LRRTFVTGIFIALTALVVLLLPQPGTLTQAAMNATTLTLDVACDGNSFALNRLDPSTSGIHRGDNYVLNGTIYPGNTIPDGGTKSSPSSFGPDQGGGIGEWFCRGTFLVDGSQFTTEKIQRATTQYFAMNDKNRIFTEGFEGSVDINRAVTGGVGAYAGARGLVTMQRLGINATGSYNLRFTFTLQ
jgi:hypothetical protein